MQSFKSKKIISFALHLVGWALFVYFTLPHFGRAGLSGNFRFPCLLVTEYILLILYFYSNHHIFVPRFLSAKRIALFLVISLAVCMLYCFAVPLAFRYWGEPPFRSKMMRDRPDFFPANGRPDFFRTLGFYAHLSQFLVVFVLSTGLKAVSQWYAEKRRLQELETSMVQAELSFLKSQIHPHFLFNSLNSIYYLALSKDDRAPEAILSLSEFLRFVTTESNHNRISLEEEVKMLEEYIHLQSLRASEKFELQFLRRGDFREREIMPLTFVPFVENAFKYGISAHTDCFIHVGIEVANDTLLFTCDNSIVPAANIRNRSTGVGLENIRKRLKLAYPGHHQLDIHSDPMAFHVKLQINPS
jgi:hypothetical protein